MKLIQRTSNKIVLEVNVSEIEKSGFDNIWDKIRSTYSNKKFDLLSVTEDTQNKDIVFVELKTKPDDD